MDEKDWKKVGELFDAAHREGLSLYAFVTVPATTATFAEKATSNDAKTDETHDVTHDEPDGETPGTPQDDAQAPEAAHLVWASSPREARLMVCFPGGHFINDIRGAAIVSPDSKDILEARNSDDIAMLEANLHAMLSQSQLHD